MRLNSRLPISQFYESHCIVYSRTKEVNFVVGLIRDRFNDVIQIGRDLVRLLQNVARIPEIEQVAGGHVYIMINVMFRN